MRRRACSYVRVQGLMRVIFEPSRGRKGRTRRITIGRHGRITPVAARKEAKRLLGEIAAGRDPAAERDRAKADKSLAAVIEQFLEMHASKLKPRSARNYASIAKLHINPYLGKMPVSEITRRDIAKRHHEMAAEPYVANRMLALLSSVFSWADSHGLCPEGFAPTRGIEHYREARRERYLSAAELARLGDALREAKQSSPWSIAAIKLLALTGARKSEILTLRWEHVDIERGLLLLPDSKTGQKAIRLNAPALAVLKSIPRLADNPFVICGYRGKRLMKLDTTWAAFAKLPVSTMFACMICGIRSPASGQPAAKAFSSLVSCSATHRHALLSVTLILGLIPSRPRMMPLAASSLRQWMVAAATSR